ncbi:MAG: SRPBCC domain-containing protein [Actinomycetota bacterium]|nr:SRPBCC domain-containing protein [Actinomycetota bacterium]
MLSYESESQIAANPEAVWAVLVDAFAWPSWDSGVDGVEGTIALGAKITIRSKAAPGRAFPVKVTTFDLPRKLVFTGGMPLGLFRGVRTYTLTPKAGGTLFHMREEYTGPMLGMISKSMPDLQPSFDQFAAGIAKRAESGAQIGG